MQVLQNLQNPAEGGGGGVQSESKNQLKQLQINLIYP